MLNQGQHNRRGNTGIGLGLTENGTTRQDLLNLAERLREEKLYVEHEKNQVCSLRLVCKL